MPATAIIKPVIAAACSYIVARAGDTCNSLASQCNITSTQFFEYNPSTNTDCSKLIVGQPVCCTSGTPPQPPQPNADGTCASYTLTPGDSCTGVASRNHLTVAEIESFNGQSWGWRGCNLLQAGQTICISTGAPPMPAPIAGAECGPQVPGTARPTNWADISSLNPCPEAECCSEFGYCGSLPAFCATRPSSTGAPGTTGCISGCRDVTAN